MKCTNCNKGINEVELMLPIDAPGTENRRWMCEACMEQKEPELLKNTIDEIPVINVIRIK